MRRFPLWASAVLLSAALASPGQAGESFAELTRRVPAQANAILLIDVDAIHQSPLAAKESWAKNHEHVTLSGVGSLPPGVERVVLAGLINPTTLDHVWKVGVAATRTTVTPGQITRAEGGTLDTVAGHAAILSRRNAYYTVLAPQVVGAMHPANRQELARWLRTADGGRDSLSPYLRGAVTGAATPILLALDTADVFDPPGLRAKLAKSKALAGRAGDLDRVVKAVAGLKGIRLAVRV